MKDWDQLSLPDDKYLLLSRPGDRRVTNTGEMRGALLWLSNIPGPSIHPDPVVPVNYREIWILSTPQSRYLHHLRFTLGLNEFLIKQNCYLISRGPSVRTTDKLPLIIYFPVLWPLDVGNDVRINITDKHRARQSGRENLSFQKPFLFPSWPTSQPAPGDDVTC